MIPEAFRKLLSLLSIATLLLNQLLFIPQVFAQESTPSASIESTSSAQPSANPEVTPIPTPVPTPSPVSEWQDMVDKATTTKDNVVTDHLYEAPQNSKVSVKFNKLPESKGKLTIKEVTLTDEQVSQTKSLSKTAYDISSDMQNGTFEYTLTLPTPKTDNVEVKASEDGQTFVTVGGVSAQTDTLTITGLNHFTIFVVTGTITENVCVTPPSGMINWWTGDNHPNDITGGSSGTLNGTTYAAGKVSQAFSFDGTDDFVQMPSSVGDFGSAAFTVDFWMYSNNTGDPTTYLLGRSLPDGGQGWDIRLHNSTIEVVGVNGWPAQYNFASDASATPNTWHHIALSSTTTNVNLFIDGVLKGSSPRSAISTTGNPFRIGFTTSFGGSAFNGLIDEVEIFNRALSQVEIEDIYNAGSAGKCKTEGSTTSLDATAFTESAEVVVINEFVFDPSSGNEWIELYNTDSNLDSPGVNLEGWTLVDDNSQNDDLALTGTIPAGGILVFEHSNGWLNNDGDVITLKNPSGTEISKITYHKDASGTVINGDPVISLDNISSGQSIGRVIGEGGTSWQAYSTPTKGWFNDAGTVNDAGEPITVPLLSTIDTELSNLGITSNIGNLDNPSNTPDGDNGLYFEKTDMGKILFTASLNLTNQNTVNVLQNLGNALEMSGGHIKFDTDTAQAMTDTGAKLFMYGLDEFTTTPNIIVKDDWENVIDSSDIVSNISFVNGTLTFNASHFTQFDVENPNVYVDSSGDSEMADGTQDNPYTTIGEGIDAAPVGGTLNIAAGVYNEAVTIGKNLTVIGAGNATEIKNTEGTAVSVTTGIVNLSQVKLSGSNTGLNVTGGNVTISNSEISANTTKGVTASEGVTLVTAVNNYWGVSSGPGNNISERVSYRPFYTNETRTTLSTATITPADLSSLLTSGSFSIPSGVTNTSTPQVNVNEELTINVAVTGGTHSISLPSGTVITKTDGTNLDATALASSDASTSSLSGLGSGVVADGAMQWGIPNVGLTFSTPITLNIYVGTALNGQTLNVHRSTSQTGGWDQEGIRSVIDNPNSPATCTVVSGICTFYATKASYYATTHTTVATTTTTSSSSSSSSSSGDGGDGRSDGLGCATHDCSVRSAALLAQVSGTSAQATGFTPGVLGVASNEQTNANVGVGEVEGISTPSAVQQEPAVTAEPQAQAATGTPFNVKVAVIVVAFILAGFGLFKLLVK